MSKPVGHPLGSSLAEIMSPVVIQFWQEHLRRHKNKMFATLILNGLQQGFKIGYQRNAGRLQQARSNMILAMSHETVVDEYLRQEGRRKDSNGGTSRRDGRFPDSSQPHRSHPLERKRECMEAHRGSVISKGRERK